MKITKFFDRIEAFYIKRWYIVPISVIVSLIILFIQVDKLLFGWFQILPAIAVAPAVVFIIYLLLMVFIINPINKLILFIKK